MLSFLIIFWASIPFCVHVDTITVLFQLTSLYCVVLAGRSLNIPCVPKQLKRLIDRTTKGFCTIIKFCIDFNRKQSDLDLRPSLLKSDTN